MKQLGLSIPLFIKRPKVTRRQKFLEEMEQVIPWAEWTNRIAPHYPAEGLGCKPFELEAMLRIHLMQQWFGYSDPGMEEALHDVPLLRGFAGLDAREDVMPDETTILKFRHLLEMMWRHDSGILLRYPEKWFYTPLKEALNKMVSILFLL